MIRIGIDFGGTKIEAAALDSAGRFVARVRSPTPPGYEAALNLVRDLVIEAEMQAGAKAAMIGVGGPGSVSPTTGLMRNANSTQLNGRPFVVDLEKTLERPVRYANDANCLALSEATDGAGQGFKTVFAAILGTGCGSGVTVDGKVQVGRNGIAGEWGHTPLPWPSEGEYPAPQCWCGRRGCLELWISGSGLARDHAQGVTGEVIVERAKAGHPDATAALDRYIDRLARGLAIIADILDPDVIVLGGGMSNLALLYQRLPSAIAPYVFSDHYEAPILPAVHGDSSGVRGAACLWAAS